jgi:hypothetical protein
MQHDAVAAFCSDVVRLRICSNAIPVVKLAGPMGQKITQSGLLSLGHAEPRARESEPMLCHFQSICGVLRRGGD